MTKPEGEGVHSNQDNSTLVPLRLVILETNHDVEDSSPMNHATGRINPESNKNMVRSTRKRWRGHIVDELNLNVSLWL